MFCSRHIERLALGAVLVAAGCSSEKDARIAQLEGELMDARVQIEVLTQERDEAKESARAARDAARSVPRPSATSAPSMPGAESTTTPAVAVMPREPTLAILNPTAGATERNNSWWRYAWRFQLANSGEQAESYQVRVLVKDANGLTIDEGKLYDKAIGPGQTTTHDGFMLVRVPGAARVKTAEFVVEAKSGTVRVELGSY